MESRHALFFLYADFIISLGHLRFFVLLRRRPTQYIHYGADTVALGISPLSRNHDFVTI